MHRYLLLVEWYRAYPAASSHAKWGKSSLEDIRYYLKVIYPDGHDSREENSLTRKTRTLLRENWVAVEALAIALLEQKQMVYSTAVAIIETALGKREA
ncbi:MAG: hypothetical protein ACR2JW_15300 [Thermomicrobiales bacterium]